MISMLFLCDLMLGKLVRWLRLIGVKTIYAKELPSSEDDELIKTAMKRKAVFLTRDEKLYEKARGYVPALLIKSNDFDEQLREVVRAFRIRIPKREIPQTLCPVCGSELKRVTKKSVKGAVWPRVYARNGLFWRCENPRCAQIYWKGTHVTEIKRILKELG